MEWRSVELSARRGAMCSSSLFSDGGGDGVLSVTREGGIRHADDDMHITNRWSEA